MFEDTFTDSMDQTVTAEVNEDGEYVLVHLLGSPTAESPNGRAVSIALSAEDAQQMAFALNTLAAGL